MSAPRTQRAGSGGFWFVWGMPLVLAVLTAFGLVAALLGTGLWHWAAWAAIALPVAIGLRHALRPPRTGHKRPGA